MVNGLIYVKYIHVLQIIWKSSDCNVYCTWESIYTDVSHPWNGCLFVKRGAPSIHCPLEGLGTTVT